MAYLRDYDYDFDYSYSPSRSNYYSKNDDNLILAFIGAYILAIMVISIVAAVATIIGMWKVFTKAGQEGWKSIIPFYNTYVLFQIAWDVKYFWYYIICIVISYALLFADLFIPLIPALIALIISIYLLYLFVKLNYNLSLSFGKSGLFSVGLIFLSPIFFIILGFSKSAVYKGNISNNQKGVNQNQNINNTLV